MGRDMRGIGGVVNGDSGPREGVGELGQGVKCLGLLVLAVTAIWAGEGGAKGVPG